MEVQNGEAEMLRVSMHKAAPQYTDDLTLPAGGARCEKACEVDAASWAVKCAYDTLRCASCIDCGVPGHLFAEEPSAALALSRRAAPTADAQAAAKTPAFADASGARIDFAPPGCVKGAHVVFVSESQSIVPMRDVIMSTVLKQVFQTHSSVAYIGGKSEAETASTLEEHFRAFGEPAVCISVQRPSVEAHRVCRDHGAMVLLDCVDNPQCTQADSLQSAAFASADALLVQTMTHRQVLRSQGMHAAVWPHPHGNFMGWSPSGPPRDKVTNVGLLVSEPATNMPDNATLQQLAEVCCAHGASLFLVLAQAKDGSAPLRVVSPHKGGWQGQGSCTPRLGADGAPVPARRCAAGAGSLGGGSGGGAPGGDGATLHVREPPADEDALAMRLRELGKPLETDAHVQGQRALYQSAGGAGTYALGTIDVGLMWPEQSVKSKAQADGPFAANNRAPTDLAWWFSHGTPVLAHSMNSYLEAGARVGYPEQLLRVDSVAQLDEALCHPTLTLTPNPNPNP